MTDPQNRELVDRFGEFYREYYQEAIEELAQHYPEKRSLYVDWTDLNEFDTALADDYLNSPDRLQAYAEEALRLYDIPTDVSFGQAHVRMQNLPESGAIRDLNAQYLDTLVSVVGHVIEATDVNLELQNAAFECQRCGTLTRIPQTGRQIQKPHECQGCERKGPFRINSDQSEFADVQEAVIRDFAAGTNEKPGEIRAYLEDDIAGEITHYDAVELTGILHLAQDESNSRTFDKYLEVISISEATGPTVSRWRDYLGITPETDWELSENLKEFVHRSRIVLNQHESLDETSAKAKIITPFVTLLGWNVFDRQVQFEYPRDPEVSGRVDYALLDEDDIPVVVIEAKQVESYLDDHTGQLRKYMRLLGSDWGVLTNGERYIFMRASEDSSTPDEARILDCELEALLDNQDVVRSISLESFTS